MKNHVTMALNQQHIGVWMQQTNKPQTAIISTSQERFHQQIQINDIL